MVLRRSLREGYWEDKFFKKKQECHRATEDTEAEEEIGSSKLEIGMDWTKQSGVPAAARNL
jgi:hypothetical protein